MNKIYKISLLSYLFLLGCGDYTTDFMSAYVYAHDLELSKYRIEQGSLDNFNARFKQLCEDNDSVRQKLANKTTLTTFEEQLLNGDINKKFAQFERFIKNAFTDTKKYGANSSIRDFAAYAVLSQPIFNILMYVFASLDDDKSIKVLNGVCKLLRFCDPVTVIKVLIQCENFYNKETYCNYQQELTALYASIMNTIQDVKVDAGSMSCISELDFSENEILKLLGILGFLLNNKNFFNTSEENKLQSVLSSFQKRK